MKKPAAEFGSCRWEKQGTGKGDCSLGEDGSVAGG